MIIRVGSKFTPSMLVFIHSHLQVHFTTLFLLFKFTTQWHSQHSTDTVSEFHSETPQATASEGLAQGPYVAARAGFEPTILWTEGIESSNEPSCPISVAFPQMRKEHLFELQFVLRW